MIEIAFVSGQLGKALYRDNGSYFVVLTDSVPTQIGVSDLQDVTAPGAEFDILRRTTLSAVQDHLEASVRRHNALFLVLTLLDPEVSLSTRVVAAQAADTLLGNPENQAFVTRRLLSIPLPVEHRSRRHEILGPLVAFPEIRALVHEQFESQPTLDQVWFEWFETLDEHAVDLAVRPQVDAHLVEAGFFAGIVADLNARDLQHLNSTIVGYAVDAATSTELPVSRAILTSFRSKLQRKFFAGVPRAKQRKLKIVRDSGTSPSRKETGDLISDFIDNPDIVISGRHLGALESKARVDKQIAAIRDVLFSGKDILTERYLQELVAFQLGQGDREYVVMSLCSLAAIALDANQLEMADQLSQYALRLGEDDSFAYSTRAEVFKHRAHFQSALKVYEEAQLRFRADSYSSNGYGDVLHKMGKLEESIRWYRHVQTQFPDNPVAFNGEVGVLKTKGRFHDALKLAVINAKRFPADGYSRGTLAACLAAVGKVDEAARHYRLAVSLDPASTRLTLGYAFTLKATGGLKTAISFLDACLIKRPSNAALENAKANLLRTANRWEEALEIYSELILRFPTYTPAKFGAAAVRILLGQLELARQQLPHEHMESELDWYGYRTLALSYVAAGDFDEAISRLSFAADHCPWSGQRVKFETALGYAELRRRDLSASVRILQKNLDGLHARDQQLRLILLGHAQAEAGEPAIASVLLNRLFNSRDPQLRNVQSSVVAFYKVGGDTRVSPEAKLDADTISASELNLALAA